ncbi:MAG TPA: EpsI family protein [Candidatus Tectomicrobia bacterium]
MRHRFQRHSSTPERFHLHVYLALALLLAFFWVLQQYTHAPAAPRPVRFADVPLQLRAWEGTESSVEPDIAKLLEQDVDQWLLRLYRQASGHAVWFYVTFVDLSLGQERNVHSPQGCYLAQGWQLLQKELQRVDIPDGKTILVNKLLVQKDLETHLVLYWDQWGDTLFADKNKQDRGYIGDLQKMLHLVSSLASDRRMHRTMVRVYAPVTDSVDATLAQEIAFIQDIFPLLEQQLSPERSAL